LQRELLAIGDVGMAGLKKISVNSASIFVSNGFFIVK